MISITVLSDLVSLVATSAHALQWKWEGGSYAKKEFITTGPQRHAGALRGDHPAHRRFLSRLPE